MMRPTRAADPDRLPAGKMLAWAGAGVSAGANFIVLGYLSIYATDTLALSPAVIGVLILVSSVANVAGGLVAAWIVDRSPETRWGKARPYEIAVIGIWLATWALFSTPAGLPEGGRIAWVFVTFLAINVVFDTLLRANDTLYMARAFRNRRVYTKVYTRSGIFTTLASVILSVSLPIALQWAGKDGSRWSIVMLVVAVVMALIGLTRFAFVKEEFKSVDDGQPPVKVRDLLLALRSGKWVWLLAGVSLLSTAIAGANVAAYYFRYVVGNLALQGVIAGIGILLLPLLLLIPRLMKRFALSRILLVAAGLGLIGSFFYLIAGGNLVLLVVGGLLAGAATLPISYLIGVMILDVCAFNEWKGKRRLESTMGALVGVFGRVGTGLAALVVGQVLAGSGYDGTKETQSDGALTAITALFAGVPALVFVGVLVFMSIYSRFDVKILPTVHRELDARREAVEGQGATTLADDEAAVPLTAGTGTSGDAQLPPNSRV